MRRHLIRIMMLITALTAAEAPLTALEFEDVAGALDEGYNVRAALLEIERLEAEVRAASYPEDPRLSAAPSLKVLSEIDGPFAGETQLTGTSTLTLPLSLSRAERDRLTTIRGSLALARTAADQARAENYVLLYSLYTRLWLLQRESAVLEAELQAGELYAEVMRERFNSGGATLAALNLAEESLIGRREALGRNRLEQNLTWFELSLNTGIEGSLPDLEAAELAVKEVPKPFELEERIAEEHQTIVAVRTAIEALRRDMERELAPDIDISVRPFWSYRDHSVSLAYGFTDPELSASWSFPVTTWGEIPSGSGSSVETWNTGVSVSIAVGTNRVDRLSAGAAGIDIQMEEARVDFLIQSTLLKVRSAYQQLLRARELLEQAQRALERSDAVRATVDARRDLDQAPRYEVLEAAANQARAEWRVLEAETAVTRAHLNLMKETGLYTFSRSFAPLLKSGMD